MLRQRLKERHLLISVDPGRQMLLVLWRVVPDKSCI